MRRALGLSLVDRGPAETVSARTLSLGDGHVLRANAATIRAPSGHDWREIPESSFAASFAYALARAG